MGYVGAYVQNGRLLDVVTVDEGQCVGVQWRHRADGLLQRDETVTGLDGRAEQLQLIGVGRADLRWGRWRTVLVSINLRSNNMKLVLMKYGRSMA